MKQVMNYNKDNGLLNMIRRTDPMIVGSCSAEDIANRIGPVIYNLWGDLGDKMLILNKKKEVIYYKEWDMYYGQSLEGALFRFSNDSNMIAIPREKTKFLIRKRDEKSFWVIHQE